MNRFAPTRSSDGEWVRSGLAGVRDLVEEDAVVKQWLAARHVYDLNRRTLPHPAWATRPYEHSGAEAWQIIPAQTAATDRSASFSIYVHMPFCDCHCGFCDCYSLPWPRKPELHREMDRRVGDLLCAELQAWGQLPHLPARPVTTLHFGGGTATSLHQDTFARIIAECRRQFRIQPETEWAIESTSRQLHPSHLDFLRAQGFTRLHVGIQTLEDPLRKWLGRQDSSDQVLERIAQALAAGFVVSADVLYALPQQTIRGLLETLSRLERAGLHGISLYRLNVTKRNQAWFRRTSSEQPGEAEAYLAFQAGDQWLGRRGFRKNHFTHYARPEDRHLYYRHALRTEDLLGLGPTADGQFGSYIYRHPELGGYQRQTAPALEGGLWETPLERMTRPAKVAIMSGGFSGKLIKELGLTSLLSHWVAFGMVERAPDSDWFGLTANGSWFVDSMLKELIEARAKTELSTGPAIL